MSSDVSLISSFLRIDFVGPGGLLLRSTSSTTLPATNRSIKIFGPAHRVVMRLLIRAKEVIRGSFERTVYLSIQLSCLCVKKSVLAFDLAR